jgi:hypothetical protein
LPVVEGKPDSNLLLESDVADKHGPVESSRSRLGERQTLDVDIGVGVGGVGERSGVIGIDGGEWTVSGKGGWAGRRGWEGVSGRLCLGFGFSLFTSRPRDIGRLAGPVIDTDGFKTVVGLCEVDVFEKVGGGGSRLSADVSNLRDVGRGGRRLQGRLERLAVGKDDRWGSVPGNWWPRVVPGLNGRERREQWRGRWERDRILGGREREEEGGRTFLGSLDRVVVGLFLLVLLLIEVEHGLFLGRLTFGQRA